MSSYAFYNPLGYAQLTTTLSSSVGLPSIPLGARGALLTVSVQNIRWRDDGTAPTASIGMLMKTTDEPFYYEGNLGAIRLIYVTSGAVLDISYYGT